MHLKTPYIQRNIGSSYWRGDPMRDGASKCGGSIFSCHQKRRSCCWTPATKDIQTVFALALFLRRRCTSKNFRVFNFRILWGIRKYFYTENFQIYGSSWYNRVRDFKMSVWDRRKEILHGNRLVVEVNQNNPTLEYEVNGTESYDGWVWVIYVAVPNWSANLFHKRSSFLVTEFHLDQSLLDAHATNL